MLLEFKEVLAFLVGGNFCFDDSSLDSCQKMKGDLICKLLITNSNSNLLFVLPLRNGSRSFWCDGGENKVAAILRNLDRLHRFAEAGDG